MSVEKRLETNPPPADRTFAGTPFSNCLHSLKFLALAIEKIKNLSLETDNSLVFGLNNNNLWPFVHIQRVKRKISCLFFVFFSVFSSFWIFKKQEKEEKRGEEK